MGELDGWKEEGEVIETVINQMTHFDLTDLYRKKKREREREKKKEKKKKRKKREKKGGGGRGKL